LCPKSAGGTQGSAVAFNILGVLGRAMLESLIVGNKDPATLADLAKRRLRS
jgi:transposase